MHATRDPDLRDVVQRPTTDGVLAPKDARPANADSADRKII